MKELETEISDSYSSSLCYPCPYRPCVGATRKQAYTQEVAENFKGRVVVPEDLEVIEL